MNLIPTVLGQRITQFHAGGGMQWRSIWLHISTARVNSFDI